MPFIQCYMKLKFLSIILLVCCRALLADAQEPKEILLWPNGAPGSEGKTEAEKVRIAEGGDHVVSRVHRPSVAAYLPIGQNSKRTAIIIAPGGGHRELWTDHEGHNLARWLQEKGIAAFVLKYRLAREEGSTYKVDEHSLADIKRSLRLVRFHSKKWGIDTARIGVMGFSAGGELAALAAMRFDSGDRSSIDPLDHESSHPAFQALIYPGSSGRFEVTKSSPPVFLLCGYKDRADISEGLAQVYLKYKQAGVPAELHIYSEAGHGFGFRPTNQGAIAHWPERLMEWLASAGFLNP